MTVLPTVNEMCLLPTDIFTRSSLSPHRRSRSLSAVPGTMKLQSSP